jgi:hypothetical protein
MDLTKRNVRIAIRDTTDTHVVGFFDNKSGIKYNAADLTQFLKGSCSVLTLTYYSKKLIAQSGCKLAFRFKGKDFWLTINEVKKTGYKIELTAYSLSLEANKEKRGPYKPANAMTIQQYIHYYDPEHSFVIGINEVADKSIKLEWTGTDTVLARLYSVANSFGAELEFVTELNNDYSLKRHVVNIYRSGNLGKNKTGLPVRVGEQLNVINYSNNINDFYTAIYCTGKDGLTINGLNKKIYDDKGKLLFFSSGDSIRAPQARDKYPSITNRETKDGYVLLEADSTEHSTKEALFGYMLSELKKHCELKVEYETEGAVNGEIGDTKTLIDGKHFDPPLYVQARISEQTESLLDSANVKTTLTNFVKKTGQISNELLKRVEELASEATPYTIKLATNNGIIFKNNQGTSTVFPSLKKGNKTVECTWQWLVDNQGSGTSATFEVRAAGMSNKLVLTAIALIDGKEVAREQVTFSNVNDGKNGSDGEKGEDGKSLRLFTTQYKYAQKFINQYSADGYTGDWSVIENTAGLKAGDSVQIRVFNTDKESDSWIVAVASAVLGEHRIKTVSKGLIEKGDQGERGPKGAAGEKGDKGDPGKPADPAPINQLKQDMELAKKDLSAVKSDLLKEKTESATKIEQVKQDVGAIRNQQTAYEQSNTQNLARITGQLGDKVSKSEVKQTADGIREEISRISVGGKNLLKGSKGEFKPDINPSNFDNNVLYVQSTSIDLVKGEKYLISAKTDGVFSNNHNGTQESDNVVLWLMDKTVTNYQIVSDSNTGTTGTLFTWNKPNGTYHLRVNTYHKDARKKVWEVKVERGTIKTDWSPAPEDTDEQITAARATFEKTAEGLKTDMTAVKNYVAGDGKRREQLEQYTRTETARSTEALRKQVSESYVAKSQYTEDVRGIARRFEELVIGGNNLLAYANLNEGGYYQNAFKKDPAYIYSKLIEIKNKNYCLQVWEMNDDTKKIWVGMQYFDEAKKPLVNGYSSLYFSSYRKYVLEVPATAKYIAISLDKRALNKDEIKFKLETGSIPTDWSPAPEDTDEQITAVESSFKQRADSIEAGVSSLREGLKTKADSSALSLLSDRLQASVKSLETDTQNKLNQKLSTAEFEVRATGIRQEIVNATKDKADKSLVTAEAGKIREEISRISVGGRNLLKGSKGEFKPDRNPSNFDNWQVLYASEIYFEEGEQYIISGKTDGIFSNNHQPTTESDNVVLWFLNKSWTVTQIVSGPDTGTIGTKFIWNKPNGTYHLRVNTYHKDARKKVWEVKVERGTIKTDWSPAPEDTDEQITAARATFEKTAEGLKTDMTAVKNYVAGDGKRREQLEQYTRTETARSTEALRKEVINGYVTQTSFQKVKETTQLYERIIGSSENDIVKKVTRLVTTNELFQVEVSKNQGLTTVQKQVAGSWAIQNLNSNGDIVSQINATGSNVRIKGESIHLDGKTLIDDASIDGAKIKNLSADKITSGTLDAAKAKLVNVDASSVTSGIFQGLIFKGGRIESLDGTLYFDLNQNALVMSSDTASIRRVKDGHPTQFIRYETERRNNIDYTRTIIGSNRNGDDSFNSATFAGVVVENSNRADVEDSLRLYGDTSYFRHAEGEVGWNLNAVTQRLSPATWDKESEIWASHFVAPNKQKNFVRLDISIAALWDIWNHIIYNNFTFSDQLKALIKGRHAAWKFESANGKF